MTEEQRYRSALASMAARALADAEGHNHREEWEWAVAYERCAILLANEADEIAKQDPARRVDTDKSPPRDVSTR